MRLEDYGAADLLALHTHVGDALRARGLIRSANAPTGDLAELIFCAAFGWEQENNSKAGYDAIGEGRRYQIKARRLYQGKGSRQLSSISNIEARPFDSLAAVLFNRDYTIWRAALIPFEVVYLRAKPENNGKAHRFLLRDDVWDTHGVEDVTSQLKRVDLDRLTT